MAVGAGHCPAIPGRTGHIEEAGPREPATRVLGGERRYGRTQAFIQSRRAKHAIGA